MKWGNKNWKPAGRPNRQPKINQDINELLKPLSEKGFKGNVWGSVITNVQKDGVQPTPQPTPSITPTASVSPSVTPSISVSPSVTPSISVTPTPTVTPTPSSTPPTPLSFQQTNTTTDPLLTSSANCVSRTQGGSVLQKIATVGGSAGSTEFSTNLGGNFSTDVYHYQLKLEIPTGTTWNAGTWTWRIDMAGVSFVRLQKIDICRVNSSGVSQSTIATVSTDLTATTRQVLSGTVSGSAQTPSAGDFVVITFSFTNTSNSSGRTLFIYPTQIIDSPFTQ